MLGTVNINNSGTGITYIGTSITASPVHIADNTAIGAVTIGNATGKVGIAGAVDATAKLKITGTTTITDKLTVSASGITATSGDISIASGNLNLPATTSTIGSIKFATNNGVQTAGTDNLFIGTNAGNFSVTGTKNIKIGNGLCLVSSGSSNIGIGNVALNAVTSGSCNTAAGYNTLGSVAAGSNNTAMGGWSALPANSSGVHNTALGMGALYATTGSYNTAIGESAMSNGAANNRNITLGYIAGTSASAKTDDIFIWTAGSNVSNTLSIGDIAIQTKCFIAGISGTVIGDAAVLIDSMHQLGTASSSRKVKENIHPIDDESSLLMQLRPVTFNYKNQESKAIQYGLIAEEVAEIMPNLAVYDSDKKPWSVRYHDLPVLLCNEYQKQHAAIATLSERIKKKSRF
jgi:hypothetical protein